MYTCNLLLFQSLDPELEAQLGKIKDSAQERIIRSRVPRVGEQGEGREGERVTSYVLHGAGTKFQMY